jgi:hypothetical protein
VGRGKLFGKRLNAVRVSSQGRLNAEKLTDEHLAAGEFALQVVGRKRKKVRTVYVPAVVKDLI